MLREIRLQNYAIIDDLSLSFSGGFSVMTGETGAGKSVFVDALALILGRRADPDVVRHESDEAVLEARFDPVPPPPDETDDTVILRRVLSRTKGRVYINGAFVNLTALRQVGESLAAIHGQHDQQSLTDSAYQLALLDAYAQNEDLKKSYAVHYQERADLMNKIAAFKKAIPDTNQEEEILQYQLTEITEAHLVPGEDTQLIEEERHLKNRGAILTAAQGGYATLSEEGGVLSQLGTLEEYLKDLHYATGDAAAERDLLQNAQIHLKELALLLRNRSGEIPYSPERQEQITQRLYLIQKMKKRYGDSVEKVLDRAHQIRLELQRLADRQGQLIQLEEALMRGTDSLSKAAASLSAARTEAIRPLTKRVKEEINLLGMEKTDFTILHRERPFSEEGIDEIEFLMALPGEPLKPIARIASGGELSRLILAVRIALTEVDPTPTLIFDEIDAGVSGAVAEQIGRSLFRLSRQHQVFCITHLPQVARFADHHYVAWKKIAQGRTTLEIRKLQPEERVIELARLLGGMTITATTRRHAEELVHTGRKIASRPNPLPHP